MMMMPSVLGENLLDDWMEDWFRPATHNPVFGKREKNLMKTDIRELEDSYELAMDLPGYKKEEVKLELQNGYLTISAQKALDKEEKDQHGNYIRKERYTGSCQRSFYVGENVKQEDVHASFEDGILKVNVPKATKTPQVEEKKYIEIQ